jgi:hypothetical protein
VAASIVAKSNFKDSMLVIALAAMYQYAHKWCKTLTEIFDGTCGSISTIYIFVCGVHGCLDNTKSMNTIFTKHMGVLRVACLHSIALCKWPHLLCFF